MGALGGALSSAGPQLSVAVHAWQHVSTWLLLWPSTLIDIWLFWSSARTCLAREAFSPLQSEQPG